MQHKAYHFLHLPTQDGNVLQASQSQPWQEAALPITVRLTKMLRLWLPAGN